MPQSFHSYLDTDVRDVFQTQSIEEIQTVQKKINYEIERKREELRMLVGERYRDLIDAADTIAAMKTGSSTVFQKLGALRKSFNGFAQSTLSSEPSAGNLYERKRKLGLEELEISVALKVSLDIPSTILSYLEQEDLIPALHLAIFFSRWIVPNEQNYKWAFLHASRGNTSDSCNAILQNMSEFCSVRLDSFDASCQTVSECILSEHILTTTLVDKILTHWLRKKVDSCQQELTQPEVDFLNMVATTLEAVYSIFIDPGLYSTTAKTIQAYTLQPSTFGLRFTPKLIQDYNGTNILIEDTPAVCIVSQIVLEQFVNPLKKVLDGKQEYLSSYGTLLQLQEYRQTAIKLFNEHCEDLMRIVLGPSTSLWKHVFDTVFQQRALSISKRAIDEIMIFLSTVGYPKFRETDGNFDIVGFLWRPSIVMNLEGGAIEDNLKMKCLTPGVSQLCEDLEFRFSELLVDFQALGDQSLKEFISSNVLEAINSFLTTTTSPDDTASQDSSASFASFGRFAIGLMDLCPTLWKLLEKNDGIQLKQDLAVQSEKCWENWTNILLETFNVQLIERMGPLTSDMVTGFMPLGEIYETESGEGGEKFVPSVRIPVELTHSVHSLLFSICMELSKVGPQCISKSVKDTLRIKLANDIITFYERFSESENDSVPRVTSQMALQFTFDLKFIQWFHSSLRGRADNVVQKLKDLIDPFDWDIVNNRMTANLKRFLFENQLTLGLLFSEESHGFIAQNFKTKQSLNFPALTRPLLYNQLPLLPL